MLVFNPCRFFTNWFVVLLPFVYYLKDYVNYMLFATIIWLGGFFITYVYPGEATLVVYDTVDHERKTIVVKGPLLQAIDLVFHEIPFLVILYLYLCTNRLGKVTVLNTSVVLILSIIYLSLFSVTHVYGFKLYESLSIVVLSIVINVLLTLLKNN